MPELWKGIWLKVIYFPHQPLKTSPPELSLVQFFFYVVGIAGVIAGHPFDTIKVRLQASSKEEYNTISGTLRRIMRHEGPLGLFKGMAAPVMGVATINALLFGVYGWILDILHPSSPISKQQATTPCLWHVFWAGCGSGLANSIISGPSELAKIKLQQQDGQKATLYRGPSHFLRETIRTHGFRSIFQGMTATLLRETPSYGVYFATFEFLSRSIEKQKTSSGLTMLELMLAGGLAGVAGWISTYPFDVIKTRIQASDSQQTRILFVFKEIYLKEGARTFTKGLGATILRAFPTNAVIFLAYKQTTSFIESLQQ